MVATAFPASPQSAGAARQFVARTLEGWGWPELVETACLLTSELVTNAFVHGKGPITLSVEVDDHRNLRVEVHDDDATRAALRLAGPAEANGRGLAIVASLSDAWGVRAEPVGKSVWFALSS